MVFGIGQGLYTSYWEGDSLTPSRIVLNRSVDLELVAFNTFGFKPILRQTSDTNEGWRSLKEKIDMDIPVMVQVDIKNLGYFQTNTSFAGHKVIVCGYDNDARTVLISDNEFPDVHEVPMEELEKARMAPQTIYDLRHNWFDVIPPDKLPPFEQIIPKAIWGQGKKCIEGYKYFGLDANSLLLKRISTWGEQKDWQWAARFTFQLIEKRGTGGGAFRLKYSQFLDEVAQYCPEIKKAALPAIMKSSADAWTEFAYQLKEISEQDEPTGFEKTIPTLTRIDKLERRFCQKAVELFSGSDFI